MTENKKNKNLGLRATPDQLKRLKQLSVDTGKPAQRLFEEAMEATYWHDLANTLKVPVVPGSKPSSELGMEESPKSVITDGYFPVQLQTCKGETEICTAEEWVWVKRTLAVVRSQHIAATKALDSNLDAFVLLAKLSGGTEGGEQSTPISHQLSEDLQEEVDALRKTTEDARRLVDSAAEHAAGDLKAGKAMRTRRKGNQGGA